MTHIKNEKYESTGETKRNLYGVLLHRIRAVRDITCIGVQAGDLGGWIESEKNLSASYNCWISDEAEVWNEAKVMIDARVSGFARIRDYANVSGNAHVYQNSQVGEYARLGGNSSVYGSSSVYGASQVFGFSMVYGNARLYANAVLLGFSRAYGSASIMNGQTKGHMEVYSTNVATTRSDNYTFSVAPTVYGPRISAGCRYFTFEEARDHWKRTRGGTKLGDETLAIVDYLERMAEIKGFMEPIDQEMPGR